jgi:hypothetical protein
MLGEPSGQPEGLQAPSGYEIRNGRPVYEGVSGGTAGYRIEDGQPVYQEPQTGYQVQDGRPVYQAGQARYTIRNGRPIYQEPSAMTSQEPPDLGIAGVTSTRATMKRENAAEDKIVASNKQIIAEAYNGDMAMTVTKELVQNGVDAQRGTPGAVMRVAVFTPERRIWAIDEGTGMPSSVVENEFTEYQGTKKAAGAAGGKGTAKAAILGRSKRIEVRTVALVTPETGVAAAGRRCRDRSASHQRHVPRVGRATATGRRDQSYDSYTTRSLLPEELVDILGQTGRSAAGAKPRPNATATWMTTNCSG